MSNSKVVEDDDKTKNSHKSDSASEIEQAMAKARQ